MGNELLFFFEYTACHILRLRKPFKEVLILNAKHGFT